MDDSSRDYHISFFKPTTPQAIANRNMVIWLVLIWFVAIFGFHILLRVVEKPTPEPTYLTFQNVWGTVEAGFPSDNELQQFGQVSLSVLGKNLAQNERDILNHALSFSLYQLTADSLKPALITKIQEFETIKNGVENISDPAYVGAKDALSRELSPILNLPVSDVRSVILPLGLTSENISELTPDVRNSIPAIMEKYLIHNQSFITDARLLGFPFHYFYTAIFLLVMFVGICWLYCKVTDRLHKKLEIAD